MLYSFHQSIKNDDNTFWMIDVQCTCNAWSNRWAQTFYMYVISIILIWWSKIDYCNFILEYLRKQDKELNITFWKCLRKKSFVTLICRYMNKGCIPAFNLSIYYNSPKIFNIELLYHKSRSVTRNQDNNNRNRGRNWASEIECLAALQLFVSVIGARFSKSY